MTTLKQDKYEGLGNGPWNEGYFPTAKQECIWNIPEDKRHCEFCTANCNKVPTISTTTAQTLEQAAEASALKKYPSFTAENYDLVMAIRKAYTIGFKAGAEWQKKQDELTVEDIAEIDDLLFDLRDWFDGKELYTEILKRFKEYKEQENK